MKLHFKRSFFVVLIIAVFGFFTTALYAEQVSSVKIQPSILEEKADPGKDYTSILRITNTGDSDQNYQLVVEDIDSIDADGRPNFSKNLEKTGFEMSSWVRLEKTSVTITPGETASIPYVISVPKDASPGGHFGAVFVTTDGKKPDSIGAAVGYRVGSLLSFQVSGDVVEKSEIREFTSDKTIYGDTNVVFKIRVKNTGNSLSRPHGMIEIIDMFGKSVTQVPLNENLSAVFPRSERTFNVTWKDDKMHLGKYTAVASMTYGSDVQRTIFSETDFWIAPSGVLTPVIGFLFFFALILYISVKLYIRKKMREYGIRTSPEKSSHSSEFSARSTVMFFVFIAFTAVFLLVLFVLLA